MEPIRVLYERGMTVGRLGSGWTLLNLGISNQSDHITPDAAAAKYGLLPIVVIHQLGDGGEVDLLLQNTRRESFGLKITDLEQLAIKKAVKFSKTQNLSYLLRALQYHCIQLSKAYAAICSAFCRAPDQSLANIDKAMYRSTAAPYYEFDALIATVRRTYDACRYLLWHYFGPSRGTVPSSFAKTLPGCPFLPTELAERLNTSWTEFGEEVTHYRDCIQHYTPVDFGNASMRMDRLASGPWVARALIPDNPSARGRAKFSFALQRDALEYGWRVANEILDVVASLFEAIPSDVASNGAASDAQPGDAPDRFPAGTSPLGNSR